jgi:hypothetical protein
VQLMLSRGTLLNAEVAVKGCLTDKTTPLVCAMYFKQHIIVQMILEHSPDSARSALFWIHIEKAILQYDAKMVRLIFDNISDRSIAKSIKNESLKEVRS